MRHRRRPLLAGPERLEGLPHLGALQVPNLGRDPFQGAAQDGKRADQLRVPIAAHHLGRRRIGPQAESLAHESLDLDAHVGVAADGAGDLADADLLAGACQASLVARDLGIPAGRLEPEGDRLGMDPVAASHHRGGPMLDCQPPRHLRQAGQLPLHDQRGVAQGDGRRRVQDVGAGQAVVQPAPLRAEPLGDGSKEGEHIVLRLALDLVRSRSVDRCLVCRAADPFPVVVRNDALSIERLRRQELDLQQELQLALLAEKLTQLGECVAVNHDARGSMPTSAPAAWSARSC